MPGGEIDRRYYELCVLSELRDRLRAGDVWVMGSRRYRSVRRTPDLPRDSAGAAERGTLPVAVDPDFERFIAGRRALLDERLAAVDSQGEGRLAARMSRSRKVC